MTFRPKSSVQSFRFTKPVAIGAVRFVRLPLSIARRGFLWFQRNRRFPRMQELLYFGRRVAAAFHHEALPYGLGWRDAQGWTGTMPG